MNARRKVAILALGLAALATGALVIRPDLSTAPGRLASLQDGMSTSDAGAVRRAAQSLHSSSAALGAATLAVRAGHHQAAARHAHLTLPPSEPIEAAAGDPFRP
jgi:hypothetical protein